MTAPASSAKNATLVALGILASRLMGLVRQKLFAHYLGNGLEAAAFAAATRIPNVLQNLLGEGVLSASFIPSYAGLRAQGRDDDAKALAGAIFGLLSLLVAALVAAGLLGAPWLVSVIAPGYQGEARALTIALVRIIFPGTGVLVLSAWCLGVLNSHKRFFLSYAAPVVWNGAILVVLVVLRDAAPDPLIRAVAWATVVGSVLQFAVQLPAVVRLLGRFDPRPGLGAPGVADVLKGFVPAVAARGVVQVSAYVDTAFATLLTERAVAALSYAQTIALLPVSLFGMAISAAELPDMSADAEKAEAERNQALFARLEAGLGRLAFFVVPSAVAFVALGDVIAAVLLQSGRFTSVDSRLVWFILTGAGVALFAQTSGRLYSSAFYALKDTRTPLRFAALRVAVGIGLGYYAVRVLPAQLGLDAELGVAAITATTGVSAWLEATLLRRALTRRLGRLPQLGPIVAKVAVAALAAGAVGLGVKWALGAWLGFDAQAPGEWGGPLPLPPLGSPLLVAPVVLGSFGLAYGAVALALGVPQAKAVAGRLLRRRK